MPYRINLPSTAPLANAQIPNENLAPPINANTPLNVGDVVAADNEVQAREKLHDLGVATDQELVQSRVRRLSVELEHVRGANPLAGVPDWFFPAMTQALQPLRNDINGLRNDSLKHWNSMFGEGTVNPYNIIPFADGADPTQPPHNLPPLRTLGNINQLSAVHVNAYLAGYGIAIPANATLKERKQMLTRAIGFISNH